MKPSLKLISVLVLFSIAFFLLRAEGSYVHYNVSTLVSNLGGLTYLYSTVGMMFAVFAAFIIVSESQDWTTLENATRNEINEWKVLLLWSKHLPSELNVKFKNAVRNYVQLIINDEWKKLPRGIKSEVTEAALADMHDLFSSLLTEHSVFASSIIDSFNDIIKYRDDRLNYSFRPMPGFLRFTVLLVDVILISLSLFIGVKNIGLDYLFMLSIVTLGCTVFIVIDDLDNPLRPGEWCLTSDGFKELLKMIDK